MAKFFRVPFAVSGTKVDVPDATQPSGEVNYTDGYGPKYSLDPSSDPNALNVERTKMNDILFDITDAIRQYQTHGFPDFITAADNGGVAYSYSKGVGVLYDDGGGTDAFLSLVNTNTALPSDATKWQKGIATSFADNAQTTTGTAVNLAVTPAGLASQGFVKGPSSATDNALSRYDTTTGKAVQDSLVTVDDTGIMNGVLALGVGGAAGNNANTIRTGATQGTAGTNIGFRNGNNVNSAATSYRAFYSDARNTGAILAELVCYEALGTAPTNSGTNAIVNGYRAGASLANAAGSTSTSGYKGELAAAANVYNLNMTGSAQNFLQGITSVATQVLVGSPTAASSPATGDVNAKRILVDGNQYAPLRTRQATTSGTDQIMTVDFTTYYAYRLELNEVSFAGASNVTFSASSDAVSYGTTVYEEKKIATAAVTDQTNLAATAGATGKLSGFVEITQDATNGNLIFTSLLHDNTGGYLQFGGGEVTMTAAAIRIRLTGSAAFDAGAISLIPMARR